MKKEFVIWANDALIPGPNGTAGAALGTLDQDEEQTSPLQAMNPEERMVADYAGTGVTVGRHPMAHCRDQLRTMSVSRADDLRMLRHGIKARIAACVIA